MSDQQQTDTTTTSKSGSSPSSAAMKSYVEQVPEPHQGKWMDEHRDDCPGDVTIKVLTIPGSADSKIREIEVCERCEAFFEDQKATDLDRFRLRST